MKTLFALTFALLASLSCTKPCSVVWTEGPKDALTGKCIQTLSIQNPPCGTDWHLWCCQFKDRFEVLDGSQGDLRHITGSLFVIVPTQDTKGKELTIRYRSRELLNRGRAPEGFVLAEDGKQPVAVPVEYVFQPVEPAHSFEYSQVEVGPTDMIPQLKKVIPANGGKTAIDLDAEAQIVPGHCPEWYRIKLDGTTVIEAADQEGAFRAKTTLENIVRNNGSEVVDNMLIEDWPDLHHRGLMLDVSRNFTTKDNLLKLMDILAHYKANVLHLHLSDDEGWRLEIPGLPELTQYGAFRGVPVLNPDGSISEPDALHSAYGGTVDRNDTSSPGNGFYTREDFIGILRYATARHIRVIPEVDIPGHSRAAIKSMDLRYRNTGDTTYLLSEPGNNSKYNSAQDYGDNALNVALPGTYAFIEKVMDEIIAMYAEAGAPLEAFHIGGDEVPTGAWGGSPACKELMKANGWKTMADLKNHFMRRVMGLAQQRGVKLAAWQEAGLNLDAKTRRMVDDNLLYSNIWTTNHGREQLAAQFANDGLGIVVSAAPNAYLDFSYNRNKLERGHSWGGNVDERRTFSLLPFDTYKSVRWNDKGEIVDINAAGKGKTKLTPAGRKHVRGVQCQLWAETIRNFDHVTYYLLPRMAGIMERGWNAEPEWAGTTVSDDPLFLADFNRHFSTIVSHEYPYYDSLGVNYHRN